MHDPSPYIPQWENFHWLCINLDDNYPLKIAQEFTYIGIYIFTILRIQ